MASDSSEMDCRLRRLLRLSIHAMAKGKRISNWPLPLRSPHPSTQETTTRTVPAQSRRGSPLARLSALVPPLLAALAALRSILSRLRASLRHLFHVGRLRCPLLTLPLVLQMAAFAVAARG